MLAQFRDDFANVGGGVKRFFACANISDICPWEELKCLIDEWRCIDGPCGSGAGGLDGRFLYYLLFILKFFIKKFYVEDPKKGCE